MTLLIIAASFVFGVLLAPQVDVRDSVLLLLLLAGLLAVPLLISMRRSSLAAVATVALVLGVMRVDLAWEDPTIALKAYPRLLRTGRGDRFRGAQRGPHGRPIPSAGG